MGATFVQKALARAAGQRCVAVGQIVDVQPDVVLSHDNTAAIARLFAGLGARTVLHTERLAIVLDHAVPAPTAEHARNHNEVRRFALRHGVAHFFDVGRGICHQVLGEEALVLPGQVILGADSHTTQFGWLGAFGAGIGRSEVAALWATGELWLRVPETIRINLEGALQAGVTAKDLSLWLLALLGPDAGVYRALEFGGPGLTTLSIESRMVIPNMMAEAGAKSAYLEPDDAVFDWLAARQCARSNASHEDARPEAIAALRRRLASGALYPDADAPYAQHLTVDLTTIAPAVAAPHRPSNVTALPEAAGTHIDQAFIGTCTNGRLEDLAAAAAVLRAPGGGVHRVAPGARLLIIPASSEVLRAAVAAGYVDTFLAAGAILGAPGCGPCMGNHFGIPAAGEVVISTANRNFMGRMGNPEAAIYLASPQVVAASAVLGHIGGPEELEAESAKPETGDSEPSAQPQVRAIDAVRTAARPEPAQPRVSAGVDVRISGIQHPASPLSGRAWKYGDDVNTDVIFPGKYTYTVSETAEMARHALEDLDPSFSAGVRPGDIIVAGRNWGCGSSREQAVTCLRAAGISAIIATSFARIYFRNAVNNGLLPVVCPEAVAAVRHGDPVTVDLDRCVVICTAGEFPFQPLSPSVARIMNAGGLLEMLRARVG